MGSPGTKRCQSGYPAENSTSGANSPGPAQDSQASDQKGLPVPGRPFSLLAMFFTSTLWERVLKGSHIAGKSSLPGGHSDKKAEERHRVRRQVMKFRPLHDRVLIKRIEAEEKTTGGIIIPDTAKEKPQQGEVIAVGPGGRDESGK